MRFLIVFLLIHIPAFGAAGSKGILTSDDLQLCMENANQSNVQLTESIIADEKSNASADLKSIHRLQLELEKLRCIYAALSSNAFGIGLSVQEVEAVREYRMVISQLALFAGFKHSELERLEAKSDADRIYLIQGRAMVDAIDDFVAEYADATEKRPKFWMNRMEFRVERTVNEKIKRLNERIATTPTPAALR